jgi:hypothetical protein
VLKHWLALDDTFHGGTGALSLALDCPRTASDLLFRLDNNSRFNLLAKVMKGGLAPWLSWFITVPNSHDWLTVRPDTSAAHANKSGLRG